MRDIKLYNGDCLELMKDIPDRSIDMILCDLPYGKTQNPKDVCLPFDKLWEIYNRVIKDNGCIALFGQGTFFIDLVNSNRKIFRYDLVWNKEMTSGFLNAKRMPLRQHEQKAVKNQNYGKFEMTDDARAGSTEKYPTSILNFPKPHPSISIHRTEKPVELLEYLIKTYTNEGETVLDNCMGSGSTGVACVNTDRNFIGIEIDKEYFDIAEKRLKSKGGGWNACKQG